MVNLEFAIKGFFLVLAENYVQLYKIIILIFILVHAYDDSSWGFKWD